MFEQLESGLPASVHMEVAILGAMLLEPESITHAIEHLDASDFSLDSHQKIYRAIVELSEIGAHVDTSTIRVELERRREIGAIGGVAYLFVLTEGIPRRFNIEAYVKIVKDKSILRQIMSLGAVATARASEQSESGADILRDMEEQVLELTQTYTQQQFVTILDAAKEAGGIDAFVSNMCDPQQMTGLSSGFIDFDKMLGGLQPSELIIIAARPSMGKTAYGINIATNVVMADPEAVVAVFSIEMSKESLHRRMLSSLAGVNGRRAAEGHISAEERRRITGALLALGDKKLFIDDTASITPVQMRAKCRRLQQREGRLDLIVVDYLQLMSPGKKMGNREQEVSVVSRGLKALAKELKVPVVALAQLSRGSEQRAGDKRPMLSDLRESGSIEQDADVAAFIHRPSYYDPENEDLRGLAEIIIAKQRNGPTGKVELAYSGDTTTFSSLSRRDG